MMSKPTYLYKALRAGLNSDHGKKRWTVGKWRKIKMCENGLHASEHIIDAMGHVPMEILAKVEVRGDGEKQRDKQYWREMRIVRAWKWAKKDSVALAIYSAGLVLKNFEDEYPDDKRPRGAIQAARRWLRDPTYENRPAAEYAAESAWSAAWSAVEPAGSASAAEFGEPVESTAWSAVWSASAAASTARSARFAARSAAESAARSARFAAAAEEKVLDKIERWIRRRIAKLEEIAGEGK